jgi:HD-GYP domain-containing protein (c-di-GMP phosphodiesterase class II)
MQIFLVEANKRLSDLFSLNLTTKLQAEVIARSCAEEAIAFLSICPDVNIIVAKEFIGTENTASEIYQHLKENNQLGSIRLVILGDLLLTEKEILTLPENIGAKALVNQIEEYLIDFPLEEQEEEEEVETPKEEFREFNDYKKETKVEVTNVTVTKDGNFLSVPIEVFKEIHLFSCDVYLKVPKGFIKRFNSGDLVQHNEVDQYMEKGATHLFIRHEESSDFIDELNAQFLEKLKTAGPDNATERQMQEYLLNRISDVGLRPSVIKLADEMVGHVMQKLQEGDSLKSLLGEVYRGVKDFRYRISFMTAILGHSLLKKMDWAKKEHIETFISACFYNDMALDDDDHLLICSERELKLFRFSEKDTKKILQHAKTAADQLKENGQISSEVVKLVLQHHGSANGIGLPETLSSNISPLSKTFMACEQFSQLLLMESSSKVNPNNLIRTIASRFKDNSMKDTLEKLSTCFVKKA